MRSLQLTCARGNFNLRDSIVQRSPPNASWSQRWAGRPDELCVSRLSDSETVWPRPRLAAPAISHWPNENIFIGGQHGPSVLHFSTLPYFLLSTAPPPPPRSHSSLFFFFLPLASMSCSLKGTCQHTYFNTDTHTHPVDHVEEGREFRENKLPFLTFNNTTPPRRCREGGRQRREGKARWRCQTRTNTHRWFRCWSPRLPLSTYRISEGDKTEIKRSVSQEQDHRAVNVS